VSKLPEDRIFPRLMHGLNRLYARGYHRLDVLSPARLPARGAAIIISNHTSGLDPHLVQAPCNRLITWMMAREYYELRFVRPILQGLGMIPVSRNGRDMSATREAMRALKDGKVLGVFPEGRIETSRELLPFQTGVALMAIKMNVPVFATYLDGTQRGQEMPQAFFLPQRATVTFGGEVVFDRAREDRDALSDATEAMRQAIATLRDSTCKTLGTRGL
jgi:1-acyl-sn-glycerol-3-phosphate acyltransferase